MSAQSDHERAERMRVAGVSFSRYAHDCEPTMEGYATLALTEIVRQAGIEIAKAIEDSGQVEVPDSLIDVVVPIEASALDDWAYVLERTGGNQTGADMLRALAQIKRMEQD